MRTETTFGHLLKKAGYATGICGKWQLGRETDAPQHFGFDEALLWQHTRRPARYANPGLELDGVEKDFSKGEYGPKLVNDFALDFVTRHKERPFFLHYPMILTNDAYQPTPDSADWDPTASGENKQKDVKHFADMVAYMDKMVGRLDAKLGELGIRENTLLLFIDDNGTPRSRSRCSGSPRSCRATFAGSRRRSRCAPSCGRQPSRSSTVGRASEPLPIPDGSTRCY